MLLKFNEVAQGITYKITFSDKVSINPYGFTGKIGEFQPSDSSILTGAGKENKWSKEIARKIGCNIAENVHTKTEITIDLTNIEHSLEVLTGFYLRYWNFTKYRNKTAEAHKLHLKTCNILCPTETQKAFEEIKAVLEANQWTRAICEEPANVCHAEYMEEMAKSISGINLKVFNKDELEKMGMNALLSVNAGSANPPKLLVMEYMGGNKDEKPYMFVGKGVTFDTGGVSIKPAANMHLMKKDMCGAASVLGLMKAISETNLPMNVVGIVPIVENAVDGKAQRPGDIWKTASGQTVEVLNTDAEGRLILCDALWYGQEQYKPEYVIDFATLTGAIMVALGYTYGGMYSNDEDLQKTLSEAGEQTGEQLWRMPLHPDFDNDVNSSIADIANIGQSSPYGGSNTAASFLYRFIKPETKWAHLDIAGTSCTKKTSFCAGPGATGFGVRLAYQWLKNRK